MKHLTSLLAGAAFVMAAAGLALSVKNYLESEDEWELYDDDCCCGEDEESCCCETEEEPAEETSAEEPPAED